MKLRISKCGVTWIMIIYLPASSHCVRDLKLKLRKPFILGVSKVVLTFYEGSIQVVSPLS